MEYNKLIAEMSLSDEVEGFYVLKAAYPKTTATGKPFLSASLSDRSGSIEIKVSIFHLPTIVCISKYRLSW